MLDDFAMFASVLPSKDNQFFPSPAFYSDLGEPTHHRSQCCNTLDMCNPEDKPVVSIENDFKDLSNKDLVSETEDPLFCDSNTVIRSIKLVTDGDSIEDMDCAKLSYVKLPESETNEMDENEVIKSCQDDATGQHPVQRDMLAEHPRFDSKDILMTPGSESNEVADSEVIKSCKEDDKITEAFSERETPSNFGVEDITNFSTIEEEEKKMDIMSSRVQTILIYSGIEGLVETQPPFVVQNEELKDRDDEEKEVQMVVQQVNIGGKFVQDVSATGTGNDEEKKLLVMFEVGDIDKECIKDLSVINIRNNEEKKVAMMIQQEDINKDLIRDASIVDTSDNEEKKEQITLQQENIDDGCVKDDASSVETSRTFVPLDDFNPTTAAKSGVQLSKEMPASEAESEIKEHCFVPSDFNNFYSTLTPRSKHAMESSRSLRSLLSSEDYFFPRKEEHPSTPSIDVKEIEPSNSHISSTTGSNGAGNNNRNDSHTSFPDKWYEDADEDEFSSGLIAFSGALTHPGLTSSYSAQVPYSGSISHRSDSSMSGRSFAFPILVSDWNSSPVKMMGDSDENLFDKRRKFWQCCFCCRRPSTSSDD